jgi:SAM-dependent methyltransferase
MTPGELHNINRAETDFWWYRGMRAIVRVMIASLRLPASAKGLDAGCGTGFNCLLWEREHAIQMYGVDLATLAIRYCREKSFTRSVAASVTALPFATGFFDLVTSLDVLSHIPLGQDESALHEFARVLRPGGSLLIRVPAFRVLRSRHSEFIAETHRYRAAELKEKVSAAGCEVVRWTYANAFLSPLALLKFRLLENLRRGQPHSGVEELPPLWLNRLFLLVLELEAWLIGRGVGFAFGQSLIVVAQKRA